MTDLKVPTGFRLPRGFVLPPEATLRFESVYVTDVTQPEEYQRALPVLPNRVAEYAAPFLFELDEIKMDYGRPVQFRQRGMHIAHPLRVDFDDIDRIEGYVNSFKSNGRKGIPGTSHRVSGGKNDSGRLDKITLRFGRLLRGVAEPLRDVILGAKGIGFCGEPASGKTTLLRDAILIKGELEGFGVNVVDTSNEILGEGDEPHGQFLLVRQDKVGAPENLVPVLKEAIRNHGTKFLYADEVGYSPGDVELVVQAARSGPSITSSVHGENLKDVMQNPTLMPLFGIRPREDGSRHVIGNPAFEMFVEVRSRTHLVLHRNLQDSVERILAAQFPITEHIITQPIRLQP